MYVLGINGYEEGSHDPSACLFKDNKLLSFVEEERFLRKKHAYDLPPLNSIQYCLNNEKIKLSDLECIAVSWNYKKLYKAENRPFSLKKFIEKVFPEKIFGTKIPNIIFVDHHLSHAATAHYFSNNKSNAILVVDGAGEDMATSIWKGEGSDLKLLKEFPISQSLGWFYEAVTRILGFNTDAYGKTMGLSSYGNSNGPVFKEIVLLEDDYKFKIKDDTLKRTEWSETLQIWNKILKKYLKENKRRYFFNEDKMHIDYSIDFSNKDKNFAGSAQRVVNEIFIALSKYAISEASSSNLAISGGVALNCVANGKVLESNLCDNLFVFPIPNDAGTSIGAAAHVLSKKGVDVVQNLSHVYLGPSFSNNKIKKSLNDKKIKYEFVKNPSVVAAELLANNKIVGWFQGKMEGGPRALGNRSILASPLSPKMKDLVNEVKFREKWRPLCPSIMEEFISEYSATCYKSPFMILNFEMNHNAIKKIPSAVHIDNTARIQTVSKKTNPLYWNLINEFSKLTGEYSVLNTSLNMKGEPIACSPNDAIKNFYSSSMDVLILGNYLLKK